MSKPSSHVKQTQLVLSYKEFGEDVKGLYAEKEVKPIVSSFIRKFLTYALFDVDLDKMPKDVEESH